MKKLLVGLAIVGIALLMSLYIPNPASGWPIYEGGFPLAWETVELEPLIIDGTDMTGGPYRSYSILVFDVILNSLLLAGVVALVRKSRKRRSSSPTQTDE